MLRYRLCTAADYKWWRITAAFVCCAVCAIGFFNFAPWASAITPAECEERFHVSVPREWRALTVNHGQFLEYKRGLPADDPVLFYFYGFLYFGGGIANLYIVGRLRWERPGGGAGDQVIGKIVV